MAKMSVFSHCSIDHILIGDQRQVVPGGAACYCGMTARRLGLDVVLHTRFGPDFAPYLGALDSEGMLHPGAESASPTTSFEIALSGPDRSLKIRRECEPVQCGEVSGADCTVISPIFAEISKECYAEAKKSAGFVLVDAQGFLRRAGPQGQITLERTDVDLKGTGAVKADPREAHCLTGLEGTDAVMALHKQGASFVLHTDGANISMYDGASIYSLDLPNKSIRDTTGVGDIFCSAFASTMARENDSLWALCFAAGAAQAALDSGQAGLGKVPSRGKVQTNASYFYNTVKFRHA